MVQHDQEISEEMTGSSESASFGSSAVSAPPTEAAAVVAAATALGLVVPPAALASDFVFDGFAGELSYRVELSARDPFLDVP